jgi:hypothetical protein
MVMMLAHPKEGHDLRVQVIQDLDVGRGLVEEHLSAPGERFHVCVMSREEPNDHRRESTLATDVRQRTDHEGGGLSASSHSA